MTPNADRYLELVRMALLEARCEELAAAIFHHHEADKDGICPFIFIDGVPRELVTEHKEYLARAMSLAHARVYGPPGELLPSLAGWVMS